MSCRELELDIAELARGNPVDAAARAHIGTCPVCLERLERERGLGAWLAAGREPALEAPARIEAVLLEAFRAGRPRRAGHWKSALAAVAAGLAFLAVAVQVRERMRVSPLQVRIAPPPAPEPRMTARVAAKPRPVRRIARARPAPAEVATGFVAVPGAPPIQPDEPAQVIRVRLPRSSLPVFGFPAPDDRWGARVQADVIVGEEGMARAVRFVRTR